MANFSTPLKRALLDYASETAGTAGILGRLRQWRNGVGIDVLNGRIRISQTAESLSLGFVADTRGQIGSRDAAMELFQELIDRWNAAWRYLKNLNGTDPLDFDVYSLMMNHDPTVDLYHQDHALRPVKGYVTCYNYMMK